MVYVINVDRKPLMPTSNAKARKLLKSSRAKVVNLSPFTIQLLYKTNTEYTQKIVLGVDSGYMNIGFSAITESKELISGEVKLLQGMKERLQEKAQYRRMRRSRLRYRKPRWNNRMKTKPTGWLAPCLKHKLDAHIKFVGDLYTILPIFRCVIEVANFDIQKMKNDTISGKQYQEGDMKGFWNLREYILHRDNHNCQNPNCNNRDQQPILEIHHIVYKSFGGSDAPDNLITLCSKCHTSPNHKEGKFLHEWCVNGKKVKGFKEATFMSMIRWKLLDLLQEKYPDVQSTYGYITKIHRITHGISKSHYNDAFAIAGGILQQRILNPYLVHQDRLGNRSLEKFYDAKYVDTRTGEKVSASELNCGRRTRNTNHNSENLRIYRGQKLSGGQRRIRKQKYFYQPSDLVMFDDKIYTVRGTQNEGKYIALRETKKVPNVNLLTPYKFKKGLNWMYGQKQG